MSNKIFHSSAGTKNAGMYNPSNAKPVVKKSAPKGTFQIEKSNTPSGKEKIFYPAGMKVNTSLKYTAPSGKMNGKIVGGKALMPTPGLAQAVMNKKKDTAFVKQADKKLKGFKFGAGVGP